MKTRSRFLAIIIVIILSLLGIILGTIAGFLLYDRLIPRWTYYDITPPLGAKDIVQVEIIRTLTDPTDDVLYIYTDGGQLFSNILFQKEWYPVEVAPKNDYEFPKCATEWKDHPPTKSEIIDSIGVRFERPISTILRCYVLYKNGTLQVWTRSTDVYSWMITIVAGGLLGFIIGITTGVTIVRSAKNYEYKHKKNAS
jgi:multisubunit Na+/H+ antiporter MnhB subunit